jgi:hypothetical protein
MGLVRPREELWEGFELLGLHTLFVVGDRVEDVLRDPALGV